MSKETARQVAIEAKHLRPRLEHVSLQPRAVDVLGPAFRRRLTVICAPAGYGKTTTTAAALEHCGHISSWYKLDILDHDPLAFLASMTRAVQRIHPEFGTALLRELEAGPVTDFPVEVLAARFCSECDKFVSADVHLVLDDYHEAMDSPALNSVLGYLLENCPSTVHFVVLTRYEPAFRLEKLHLAGDVSRVPRDLFMFDLEQVTTILAERSGRRQDPENVRRLHQLTEGWPASVVLAGMALAWLDVTSLEEALADPRLRTDMFSYLAEQVFQRQSEEVQRFMLSTCCLEHITSELAEILAVSQRASRHLHYLARNHIFTFATDRVGAYRYHNLMRDFLRQRFVHDEGEAAFRVLQRRTAVALEDCGDQPAAVELLLSANELELALGVVSRGGEALLERRPSEQLRIWAARLLTSVESGQPWALIVTGVMCAREGRHTQALLALRQAAKHPVVRMSRESLYETLSITEWAEFWAGDSTASMDTSHRALAVAQTESQRLHTLLSLVSAGLDMRRWDVVREASDKVAELLPRAHEEEAYRARALQAHAAFYQGYVRRARSLMDDLPTAEASIAQRAATLNTRGMIDLALADYESADRCFRDATDIGAEFGRSLTCHIEDNCAFLESAVGRHEESLVDLAWIIENSASLDPAMLCSVVMHKGTVLRRCRRLDESSLATQEAIEMEGASRDPYLALNAQANLALTEGLEGRDRMDALLRIQSSSSEAGLNFVRLKAQMFSGILAYLQGDHRLSEQALCACLPEQLELGHINLVTQELTSRPQLAAQVLQWHRRSSIGPRIADALSRYWDSRAIQELLGLVTPQIASWLSPTPTPKSVDTRRCPEVGAARTHTSTYLTPREAQILELIASDRSNEEIAQELYIAVSTVKTHVNHILRKLEQKTRVGAILEYQRLAGQSPPSPQTGIHPRYDSGGIRRR